MDEGTKTATKLMLDDMHKEKIDMADSIYVVNPGGYIGNSTWSEICYAYMTGKEINAMDDIDMTLVRERVQKHIEKAKEYAWQQMDGIRHSDGYYNIDDFVHFKHKGKIIVDPWINVETHYNGTPWIDHEALEQSVNPFEYYGQKKAARFIEGIILKREP